jgi:hypothetical protein
MINTTQPPALAGQVDRLVRPVPGVVLSIAGAPMLVSNGQEDWHVRHAFATRLYRESETKMVACQLLAAIELLTRCRTQIEAYEGACYSEPPPMEPISALLTDIDAVLGPNVAIKRLP